MRVSLWPYRLFDCWPIVDDFVALLWLTRVRAYLPASRFSTVVLNDLVALLPADQRYSISIDA